MIKKLKAWTTFLLLTALSKASPPLPRRSAQSLRRSAAKRDPRAPSCKDGYDYLLFSWAKIRAQKAPDLAQLAKKLHDGPLFSVVVPVYNTEPKLLASMIDSVRAQSYEKWELCLADDGSTDLRVHKTLRKYAAKDSRIKVVFRPQNGHISAASNSAIELATGDFIVLVDHDDLVDPDALLLVAKEIHDHPEVMIVYTDADIVSVDGKRNSPYFKTDWDRLLICANNYVCHLAVYKSELVRKVGGFRLGFEGSQDHDLLLRCSEQVNDEQIVHIPKVLYSWRASPCSVAASSDAKPYANDAGRRAVAEHLQRMTGQTIQVDAGPLPYTYRPIWPVIGNPLVSIIIPTRDRLDVLKACVESVLQKTHYQNYEIIIVDNGSVEPPTLDWLAHIQKFDPRVRVIRDDRPFNYSALNNAAVGVSRGEYLLLLNNDIEVISPDWLREMLSLAQRDRAGCIGAKLYYPDGRIQHAGVLIGMGGYAGHLFSLFEGDHPGYWGRLKHAQNYTASTGACLLISRKIFDQVGGLNEVDLAVAFNDIDLCLKVAEAGYQNAWTPYAELIHHESLSRGYDDTPEKQARARKESDYMLNRWKTDTFRDPAYNPNLTLDRADFSFATPIWPL